MKKPVTHALIVAGFNPAQLYKSLNGVVNIMLNEQETMSRYGCRLTKEEEQNQDQIFKLMQVLDEENEITMTKGGKIKTELN